MTDPIDIKSKKIIKNQSTNSFSLDKNSTLESIENNILEILSFYLIAPIVSILLHQFFCYFLFLTIIFLIN